MRCPPDRHHRRSVRLRQYDYRQSGAYFVTLCTYNRQCLFGEIIDGRMVQDDVGRIVATEWERTPQIRHEIDLDAWVLMPNHLHAIIVIAPAADELSLPQTSLPAGVSIRGMGSIKKSLSSLVQGFKSATTVQINAARETPHVPVWQRGFYEHVIPHEADLRRIREYVADNPRRWAEDENNPSWIATP